MFVDECAIARAHSDLIRPGVRLRFGPGSSLQRREGVRLPSPPLSELRLELDLLHLWPSGHRTPLRVKLGATAQRRGVRWWFMCPACGRRCFCLYSPSPNAAFFCRLCWQLSYRTQYEKGKLSMQARYLKTFFKVMDIHAALDARGWLPPASQEGNG
jgi:hypothetical protein